MSRSLLLIVLFKYACYVFMFTLGQCLSVQLSISEFLAFSISWIPKDGEVLQDANAGSIGSFEDLRAYFDQRPSHEGNRSFRPKSVSPQVVSPQLRVVSPQLSRPRHLDDAPVDRWPIVFVKFTCNKPSTTLTCRVSNAIKTFLLNICVVKEPRVEIYLFDYAPRSEVALAQQQSQTKAKSVDRSIDGHSYL